MPDIFDQLAQEQDKLGAPVQAVPPPPPTPETTPAPPAAPPTPQQDIFAEFAKQQDTDRADRVARLGDIMGSITNPDRKAAVLSVSRKTGADPSMVEQNLDFWKAKAEQATSPEDFYTRNPDIAKIALDHPWVGEIVTKDKPLNVLQRALGGFRDLVGFTELDELDRQEFGAPQFNGENASWLRMFDPAGKIPGEVPGVSPPVEKLSLEAGPSGKLEGAERTFGKWDWVDTSKEHNPWSRAYKARDYRQQVPGIYQAEAKKSFESIDLGQLALRYMASKASGGDTYELEKQALAIRNKLPQEYNAGPTEQVFLDAAQFVGSDALSLGATVGGGYVGGPTGAEVASFGTSFLQESSNLWEFRDLKDDKGRPVDDQIAVGGTIGYALTAAAVETGVNMGPWMKLIGPLGKEGTKKEVKLFLKQIAKDPIKGALLAKVAQQWAHAAASEGAEEGIQNILQDLWGWYAKSRSAGEAEGGSFSPQHADPVASVGEALDVAGQATVGAFVTGGLGAGRSYVAQRHELVRSIRAGQQLAAITTGMKDSPTAVAAPEIFAQVVAAETASTGEPVKSAHIDTAGIIKLAQDENLDPVELVKEAAGEAAAERFKEAVATGQKLEVPMAEYIEKWGPSGLADQLLKDTTTRSTGLLTPNQIASQKDRIIEDTKRLVDEVGSAEDKPTPFEQVLSQIGKELETAGRLTKGKVEPQVQLWRKFLRTEAAKNGATVDDAARRLVIRIANANKDVVSLQDMARKALEKQGPAGSAGALQSTAGRAESKRAYEAAGKARLEAEAKHETAKVDLAAAKESAAKHEEKVGNKSHAALLRGEIELQDVEARHDGRAVKNNSIPVTESEARDLPSDAKVGDVFAISGPGGTVQYRRLSSGWENLTSREAYDAAHTAVAKAKQAERAAAAEAKSARDAEWEAAQKADDIGGAMTTVEQADLERVTLSDKGYTHPESPLALKTTTEGEFVVARPGLDVDGELEKTRALTAKQGYSTALYLRALLDAQKAGLGWQSDMIRTDVTEDMYVRLKRLEFPVRYSEDYRRNVGGHIEISAEDLAKMDIGRAWRILLAEAEIAGLRAEGGRQLFQDPLDADQIKVLDGVVASLEHQTAPEETDEVVTPAPYSLFQLERDVEVDPKTGEVLSAKQKGSGFDEYLENIRSWMEKNGYSEKEIRSQLGGILGQLKIFQGLGAKDLKVLPVGAGEAGKWGSIRKNIDPIYKITFDASAMCVKRLEASATQAYIEAKLKRSLTASERLALVSFFREAGKTAPCIYCYVESPRAKAAEFAARAVSVITGATKLRKGAKAAEKKAAKAAVAEFKKLGLKVEDVDANLILDPQKAKLSASQERILRAPAIYDFIAQQALYAKANQPKLYEEYSGQILKVKQKTIDELNRYAGFRFFSTSDFQAEHVIDLIQAFRDLSLRKARAHAYTKVVDFIRLFGGTGMKIQTSVFASSGAFIEKRGDAWVVVDRKTGKALHESKVSEHGEGKSEALARDFLNNYTPPGGFLEDTFQGMAWKDAQAASKKHADVGAVLVATSDAQIRWALDQPWIHYIIPFHYSGLESKYYEQLGWSDFTSTQSEKAVKGAIRRTADGRFEVMFYGKVTGIFDSESAARAARKDQVKKFKAASGKAKKIRMHELTRNGKGVSDEEMTKRYLKLAKERGLEPVFAQFADHPNYAKLKKDYARSDTDFRAVDANAIDMKAADQVLQTVFAGTAPRAKADKKIGDRMIKLIEAGSQAMGEAALAATESGRSVAKSIEERRAQSEAQGLKVFAGEGAPAGPRGWMETVKAGSQRILKIVLGGKQDLSTFLHESGHAFFELKADLAEEPLAPELRNDPAAVAAKSKARADLQAALEWMGVSSRDELSARAAEASAIRAQAEQEKRPLTAEEKARVKELVAPFEKWARGFEAYLMHGKAPSLSLAGAFRTFKHWLTDVYKDLAGLGVPLDDRIRGVFDRMLATDKEIEEAGRSIGINGPALEEAKSRAEIAALKDVLRADEAWWKEGLRKETRAAEVEFAQLPSVRAWRLLRRGDAGGDNVLEALGKVKLDYASVVDLVGTKAAEKSFRGLLQKFKSGQDAGLHPDHLAEILGVESGKKLLEDMLAVPEPKAWIDARAQQAMEAKHPDVLSDRARLKELVGKALHEEPSVVDELHRQWSEDRKKAGKEDGPSIEAVREAARIIIGRQLIQQVDPRKYYFAERDALKRRAAALAVGDSAAAAKASQERLLNFYLYREATLAKEAIQKIQELGEKLVSRKGLERLGQGSPVFRDMALRIMQAAGLIDGAPPEVQQVGMLALVQEMAKADMEPDFDLTVIEGLFRTPKEFNDLSMADLETVSDALKQIARAARNRNTVLVNNKRISLAALLGDIKSEASRLPKLPAPAESRNQRHWKQGVFWTSAQGYLAAIADPLTLYLDDEYLGKSTREALRDGYYRARAVEHELLKTVGVLVDEAFKNMPAAMAARRYDLVDRSMLPALEGQRREGKVDRQWMWLVLANMGNPGNLRRLLGGRKWTMEGLHEFFKKNGLTEEEAQFIQGLWDINDKYLWPRIVQVHEAVNGTKPRKVEANALTLELADGKTITLRGGYWPAMYDPEESALGGNQAEISTENDLNYETVRASILKGFTRGRAENYEDVIRLDDFGLYPGHISKVIRYIAYEQYVRDANRIFAGIKTTVDDRLGKDANAQLQRWLHVVASGSPDSVAAAERGLVRGAGFVVSRTVLTAMLINLKNAMADLATPLMGLFGPNGNRVSPIYLTGALVEGGAITALAGGVAGGAPGMVAGAAASQVVAKAFGGGFLEMRKVALAKSKELPIRHDEAVKKVRQKFDRIAEGGKRWQVPGTHIEPGVALDWIHDHGFIFQHVAGVWGETVLWTAKYRQGLAEGVEEKEAIRQADDLIQKVYPSTLAAEKSHAVRSKGFIGAFMLMQGFFNRTHNRVRQTIHPALVEWGNAEGWFEKGKVAAVPTVTAAAMTMGILTVLNVIGALLEGRGPEPGEEIPEWLKRKYASAPLTLFPLISEFSGLAEAAVAKDELRGKLAWQSSERAAPVVSSALRLINNVGKAFDGSKDEGKRAWAAYEVAAFGLGLPVSQVKRSLPYLADIFSGVEANPQLQKFIYGDKEDAPDNPGTILDE